MDHHIQEYHAEPNMQNDMELQEMNVREECGARFQSKDDITTHDVEKHNDFHQSNEIPQHEKTNVCSECGKVLPNNQKAIKSHMMNHIMLNQKSVVIGGASQKKPMPSKPFLTK